MDTKLCKMKPVITDKYNTHLFLCLLPLFIIVVVVVNIVVLRLDECLVNSQRCYSVNISLFTVFCSLRFLGWDDLSILHTL